MYTNDQREQYLDIAKEAKRLSDLGVSGITTNRPAWLKEEMAKL